MHYFYILLENMYSKDFKVLCHIGNIQFLNIYFSPTTFYLFTPFGALPLF